MTHIDETGKKIGEKKSSYQNTQTKEEKAAHLRLLDDKGKK